MYREYARELVFGCDVQILLKQIGIFSEFLSLREYRYEILLRRVREMVRIWEQDDRVVPDALLRKIREFAAEDYLSVQGGMQERLFQSGYLITLMTIYACAGDYMDEPVLSVLLSKERSLDALWEVRKLSSDTDRSISYLTVRSGILQDRALPRHRFFGREEALFDIRELAFAQRKCLISGIGGIGKTELLRQLLSMCEQEILAEKIAVVHYQTGIAESLVRAFPDGQQMETEDAFRRILSRLCKETQNGIRLLILVDDLDKGMEEDPNLRELAKLPCGVLITSRRSALEGFETYRLEAPSVTTGTLIFRDNYGRPMTREDRELLRQMLKNEDICHPLTLNLMARAAGRRDWSVARLLEHLKTEGSDVTWVEEDRVLRTRNIYNQLYSLMDVPDSCRQLTELFTLLPSGSHSLAFLTETFPEMLGEDAREQLHRLTEGGWLEELSDGYAMHPLVAECLRRKVITEDRQRPLLESLRRRLPPLCPVRYEMELQQEEIIRTAHCLLHAAGFLTGSIGQDLMLDLLNAASLQPLTKVAQQALSCQLTHWRKHCRDWNDMLQVTFLTVLSNWDMAQLEECKATYAAQKNCLTVPKKIFLDFCLRAGQFMTCEYQEQLSKDMLKEVLCEEATPLQKAMAYYNMSGYYHILGSAEEAMRWSERGVAYTRDHPECGNLARFNNLHMLCNMYLKYRKKGQAWSLIQEMELLLEGNTRMDLKSQYLNILGLYEMTFGDPEKALEYMQENMAIYKELFGMERNYYLSVSMLGSTYIRLNRLEDAVEQFSAAIAYGLESKDSRLLQSASNNISVALMKMERPKEALVHLETAVSEGRKIGGLMFGESLRNTAIAWGQLGDEEKELAYYEEAWPLLLEAYGPDHPRAADARKRMDALKNKK